MYLVKSVINGIGRLFKPTVNMREVIPGWDNDYPEPMFDDNWRLTSELDLSNDYDFYDFDVNSDYELDLDINSDFELDEPIWLTEEEELIAQYGWSKLEFVKDQEWICDDLEHYLGKYNPPN